MDSRDDWVCLRTQAYGDDPILKMCDVSNKCCFGKHVICAGLYEKKIIILIGQEDSAENEAVHRLSRYLEALKRLLDIVTRSLPRKIQLSGANERTSSPMLLSTGRESALTSTKGSHLTDAVDSTSEEGPPATDAYGRHKYLQRMSRSALGKLDTKRFNGSGRIET